MDERQAQLLTLIIENYIETAEPVGSKFLVSTASLDMSGATVRNEMHDLEEAGYLTHPHTSAGRIPTEAGYRYYVENILQSSVSRKTDEDRLSSIEEKEGVKGVARYVAEITENAVIVAFGSDSLYYTGISYLFGQPEFRDAALVVSMSRIFDHCERSMEGLYEISEREPVTVLIGKDNPLGDACSTIITKQGGCNLFACIGPLRMQYEKSIRLAKAIHSLV